ncbi:hypothetical protein BH10BDE1_BH10BDE1_03810 [soil metagenome]
MSKADLVATEKTVISESLRIAERATSLGRFDVIRPLGQGGMGEVFLVTDREHPGRGELALKTIFPELMQDREIVSRFESEAKMLSSIQHPNVVKLIEWGILDNEGTPTHFMAMEYIDGISLHTLARRRRLSLAAALNLSVQIAKGLHAIHVSRVVHRDLKPANVMITREGLAKIIDFGIAKPASMGQATDDDPERGFKTKTGMVIGTVNYIAPEVLRGEPASIATDVYALGLIVWEMVNGVTPFKSKSLAETMSRVTNDVLEWSDAIFDIAPPGFTKLIAKLSAKDPHKRIVSAKVAAEELARLESNATWAGRFGDKTRFDIDIAWDPETIEAIRAYGVKDSDVGFVLQEIEGRLIDQGDERLSKTGLIAVENELLKKAIDSYQSMRYQAAMTKVTRVREQAGIVGSPNSRSAGTGSGAKVVYGSAKGRMARVASVAVALIVIFAMALLVFTNAQRRLRAVASENENASAGMLSSMGFSNVKIAPVATVGTDLTYRRQIQTVAGTELVTNEHREIRSLTTDEVIWTVDGNTTIRTPRSIIPLEMFFKPIHRTATASMAKRIENLESFKVGETFSAKAVDEATESSEETRCTLINSRRQLIVTRNQEVWKIECMRTVEKAGRLTHRILEIYEYVPAITSILSLAIKSEELRHDGAVNLSTLSRIDVLLDVSKLRQSDANEPSPW